MSMTDVILFGCGLVVLAGYIIVGVYGLGKMHEQEKAEREDYANQKVAEAKKKWEKEKQSNADESTKEA